MFVAAIAAAAPNASPLDVQITLSSDRILLGEPLWVDVRVTNRSSEPLSVDMGNACFGARPLVVEVPDADVAINKQRRCGVKEGGSCLFPGPQVVSPGATLSKRYVFDGDFHITHGGRYIVHLIKPLRYGPAALPPTLLTNTSPSLSIAVDTSLIVLPPDPQRLLSIERALAVQEMATVAPRQFPPGADIETVRRIDTEYHTRLTAMADTRNAIVDGLAAYPAAGMEPFFASQLRRTQADYYSFQAATALYHLNTATARADFAQLIEASPNPNTDTAVWYLGFMEDPSYLPLLERTSNDLNPAIRREAILALGTLGGEAELPYLESLVQSGTAADRSSAVIAIGYTGTTRAIPFLITLLDKQDSRPEAEFSLWLLTHHRLSQIEDRTWHGIAVAWKTWWAENATTARAYRPWEDCPDDKTDLANGS